MTCEACAQAELNAWTSGSYQVGCQGCEARAVPNSPHGSQALKDALLGHPGAIQAIMRALWPKPADYTRGRTEVYRWAQLIDAAREAAKEQR
jgi:hypothetical protein